MFEKREIEARGQSIQAAIEAGLAELGLGRDDVIVEVIDEGSRGLLGIGSRDAVVRLTSLATPTRATPPVAPKIAKPEPKITQPEPESAVPEPEFVAPLSPDEGEEKQEVEVGEKLETEAKVACEVVQTLLDALYVKASITAKESEPDDLTGQRINVLDIQGDDLSILIGPHGETLNALQYISRLIVGHRLRQRAGFVIDVEGYRQRREQALARLADRMAQKVLQQHRPISLEPMPPHERRIIHITLRDHEGVYTESVGEGKRRKVRILPVTN